MEDLSIQIVGIRRIIKEKHQEFVGQYNTTLIKKIAEEELSRDKILAKIKLVANIFVDLRIIDRVAEMDIDSINRETYSRSLLLSSKLSAFPIFIMNDSRNVIITDSMAIVMSPADDLKRMTLITSENKVYSLHSNVLSHTFLWNEFAMDLLSTIHKSIYARKEVIKAYTDGLFTTIE